MAAASKAVPTGTVKVKVRSLVKGAILDVDFVLVELSGRDKRVVFSVSPLGTADANVLETEIEAKYEKEFKEAIVAKRGVVIQQNPKWDDVKTDDGAAGDGTADDGKNEGTRYNWAHNINDPIYETV